MGSGFKTFTSGPLTSADVNGYLMSQVTIKCTSTTRPSAPDLGMRIYETDTDTRRYWDGSRWAPDQSSFFAAGKSGASVYDEAKLGGRQTLFSALWPDQPAGRYGWQVTAVMQSTGAATAANFGVAAQSGTAAGVSVLADPYSDLTTSRLPYAYGGIVDHAGGDLRLTAQIILPGTVGAAVDPGCRIYRDGSLFVISGGA